MPKIADTPKNIVINAFNAAMADTPFDGMMHRLFQAMNLPWYNTPEDARSIARRLFESFMQRDFATVADDDFEISIGCIKLSFFRYESNFQCEISFDAVGASGTGRMMTNEI